MPTVFTINENDEGGFAVTARDLVAEGAGRHELLIFTR